jgi:hypothetical protein
VTTSRPYCPERVGASADRASAKGTSFVAGKLDCMNEATHFRSSSISNVIAFALTLDGLASRRFDL